MGTRRGTAHADNILHVLLGSRRPLSAYDLLERLRPTGITAPLTIYRALDRLTKDGKVHRVESLNAFVACKGTHDASAPGHDQAVAFTICDACGTVDEIVDERLSQGGFTPPLPDGFIARSSTLEVHGVCGACREQ